MGVRAKASPGVLSDPGLGTSFVHRRHSHTTGGGERESVKGLEEEKGRVLRERRRREKVYLKQEEEKKIVQGEKEERESE